METRTRLDRQTEIDFFKVRSGVLPARRPRNLRNTWKKRKVGAQLRWRVDGRMDEWSGGAGMLRPREKREKPRERRFAMLTRDCIKRELISC